MREIRVFIASSTKEFEAELLKLKYDLNNMKFPGSGVTITARSWHDFSRAAEKGRKQNVYNREIRHSDLFVALIGKKAGEFTNEEFKTAYEQFKTEGYPIIVAFFKNLSEGEEADSSVEKFRNAYKGVGQYYDDFNSISEVEVNIRQELERIVESRRYFKPAEVMWEGLLKSLACGIISMTTVYFFLTVTGLMRSEDFDSNLFSYILLTIIGVVEGLVVNKYVFSKNYAFIGIATGTLFVAFALKFLAFALFEENIVLIFGVLFVGFSLVAVLYILKRRKSSAILIVLLLLCALLSYNFSKDYHYNYGIGGRYLYSPRYSVTVPAFILSLGASLPAVLRFLARTISRRLKL